MPDAPSELRALARADSLALDPHKWLYQPVEAGCALVRDREKLRDAFSYRPVYYHLAHAHQEEEDEPINYFELGPQNSRGFRALKVWLALKQVGAAGYRQMIADDIRLSQAMARAVEEHDELQRFTQDLSIATFRYVPRDLRARLGDEATERYLDALNRDLLDRLQRGGEIFVSNAVIGGRYVLRACIVNFHTTQSDIDALPGIVARVGQTADAALRSTLATPGA